MKKLMISLVMCLTVLCTKAQNLVSEFRPVVVENPYANYDPMLDYLRGQSSQSSGSSYSVPQRPQSEVYRMTGYYINNGRWQVVSIKVKLVNNRALYLQSYQTNIGWQGGGYQAQAIGRQDPQYIREQFQWKAYAPGLCRDIYFNF